MIPKSEITINNLNISESNKIIYNQKKLLTNKINFHNIA